MAGPRSGARAREEARLLESREELFRLRRWIDDIIFPAVDQKETGAVLIDCHVAQRRRLEEQLSADHWWAPEEFLGNLVTRTGHLVVLPLRQHVVDAIESDHRLHSVGGSQTARE